jgi:hypothetical protein
VSANVSFVLSIATMSNLFHPLLRCFTLLLSLDGLSSSILSSCVTNSRIPWLSSSTDNSMVKWLTRRLRIDTLALFAIEFSNVTLFLLFDKILYFLVHLLIYFLFLYFSLAFYFWKGSH